MRHIIKICVFLIIIFGSTYIYAQNLNLQNKEQFENGIISDFSKEIGADNIIQESKPKKGIEGITGKRKPDLVSIDKEDVCTMWETKSPAEAKGKSWFANPRNDYIATCRNKYAAELKNVKNNHKLSKRAKKAKKDCLAWTIVIGCQMRHYAENYKNEWHLPATKSNACNTINRIGLIAPIGYEISNKPKLYDNVEAIKCALETLGIKGEVNQRGNKIYTTFDSTYYKIPFGKSNTTTTIEKAITEPVISEKGHHKPSIQAEGVPTQGEHAGKSKIESGPSNATETTRGKAPSIIPTFKEKVSNVYTSTRNKIATVIDDTSKICTDFYRNVSHKISTFFSSTAEKFSKLCHAMVEYFTKPKDQLTQRPATDRTPVSTPSSDTPSHSLLHSEVKPDSHVPSKQPGTAPTYEIAKPSPAWHSTFGRIYNGLMKASVAFSIVFSGYTMTKEVYEKAKQGVVVHPSRVLARGIVGFAGAMAGGIALGAACASITIGLVKGAVISCAIGIFIGSLAGGIGAEWLFEWIVPMNGFGWAVGDFLLGGLVGSILGFFPGAVGGYAVATVRNSLIPEPKILPKGNTFWKKIKNGCINIGRKVKHCAGRKRRKLSYAFIGSLLGFIFGGFCMATMFLYLFNHFG